jgi:hypothetical protein
MTLRAAILRSQPRDLGLVGNTACLLLPHKLNPSLSPNPPSHCKIGPTRKVARRNYSDALHSIPEPSDSDDDGWTDKRMAKLDNELGLGLTRRVDSSMASAPTFPRPCSVKAPQDEIQSRECTYTTGGGLEEHQGISRHGTAQGLEKWEQAAAGGACGTEVTTLAASCG